MEEIEAANRAAVESCHKILSLLANKPQDQLQYKNLMVQTGDAVVKFKKVVTLLDNGLGHARVKMVKKISAPVPQSMLQDNPTTIIHHHPPKPLQLYLESHPVQETVVNNTLSLATHQQPSLELSSNGKHSLHISQNAPHPSSNYHFLQQQQKLKQHAEMMYRRSSNSGINLNFDSSTCTPTISSNRSFMSSLSIEGSVTNLDGGSFRLIGSSLSADQAAYQHKRRCSVRGDDGSVKCGSSGRCHCSKKRLIS